MKEALHQWMIRVMYQVATLLQPPWLSWDNSYDASAPNITQLCVQETLQPSTGEPPAILRITFFLYKSPDISEEDFHRHWETVHADLTVASKAFKNVQILRYVQVSFVYHLLKQSCYIHRL